MAISYAQLKFPGLRSEPLLLDEVNVRLINPETERAEHDLLNEKEHYLHSATAVGNVLRYVAEYRGRWLAVMTFCSAAFHLKARDQFFKWSAREVPARRHLIAQNCRFLVLPDTGHWPNLASRILKQVAKVISGDWLQHFGHPVLALETFVDSEHFRGTCYKAAGWVVLGGTKGCERHARDFYGETKQPRELWVKPLSTAALATLRAPELPPELRSPSVSAPPAPAMSSEQLESFWDFARQALPEFRDLRGIRYPLASLVSVAALAVGAGCQGWEAIAQFAKSLSHPQRRRLRCRPRPDLPNQYDVPCQRTFERVLKALPSDHLVQLNARWMAHLDPTPIKVLHFDGKVVKRAQAAPPRLQLDPALAAAAAAIDTPVEAQKPKADKMLNLVNFQTPDQRLVDQIAVPADTNEEAAVAAHLPKMNLCGVTIIADAAHTTKANCKHLSQDQGADYIFFLKGNQPTAFEHAKRLLPESVPPSASNEE